jgi:hypothetical protein
MYCVLIYENRRMKALEIVLRRRGERGERRRREKDTGGK